MKFMSGLLFCLLLSAAAAPAFSEAPPCPFKEKASCDCYAPAWPKTETETFNNKKKGKTMVMTFLNDMPIETALSTWSQKKLTSCGFKVTTLEESPAVLDKMRQGKKDTVKRLVRFEYDKSAPQAVAPQGSLIIGAYDKKTYVQTVYEMTPATPKPKKSSKK